MADEATEKAVKEEAGAAPIKSARELALERAAKVAAQAEAEAAGTGTGTGTEAEALRAKAAEADRLLDQLKRATADYVNFKNRVERERGQWTREALRSFVLDVLPAVDALEAARAAAAKGAAAEALAVGLDAAIDIFKKALESASVTPIEAKGEPFDPRLHEALLTVEDASVPDQTVRDEGRRGYRFGDAVLRPAQVVVARGGPRTPAGEPPPAVAGPEST